MERTYHIPTTRHKFISKLDDEFPIHWEMRSDGSWEGHYNVRGDGGNWLGSIRYLVVGPDNGPIDVAVSPFTRWGENRQIFFDDNAPVVAEFQKQIKMLDQWYPPKAQQNPG